MTETTEIGRVEIETWLLEYHNGSTSLDADSWLDNFYTEDISLQYANLPILTGVSVRQMFKETFAKLDMMTHDIVYFGMFLPCPLLRRSILMGVDYVSPRLYQAATIRYLVKGDNPEKDVIEIPGFATFFVRKGEDGKIRCYKAEIFLDPLPVFQRIAEKGL
ncbi:hypothetical protein CDV36_000863 [Fusarium kuroshium]|uniref:SnoaL-like domain-containing protein n=2 Tax=Fusarium solani species complex TaxID=232080 RepID=A0A3M2SPI5_9HYPO|nr:hypothetical protein CDV36_000863 [Fusarium kuroshium]RSL82964.1 hypothetical protein CEP51_004812 [Fusarium floridanum]